MHTLWNAQPMKRTLPFTAPIITAVQIKRAIRLTSLLIGPKPAAKTDTEKMSLNLLQKIIYKIY
jgi:hypothetical protein